MSFSRLSVVGVLFCALVLSAFAGTVYVSPTGSHTFPFTNAATAATNIDIGVNAARDGDVVLVADGTYMLGNGAVTITNAITVLSRNGAASTVVDGGDATRCFYIAHSNAVVNGFTIRNGKEDEGGGVYIRTAGTLRSCIVVSNAAPNGGGVFMYYGGLVTDCTVAHNRAMSTNSSSADSWFFYGGGVNCYCGGTVQDTTIMHNFASSSNLTAASTYYCYGGGVRCWHGGLVQNCLVVSNSAYGKNSAEGGGVSLSEGGILANSIVHGNRAVAMGSTYASSAGGGVHVNLSGSVRNCTIVDNYTIGEYSDLGNGLMCWRGGTIRNSIIYFNGAENCYNDVTGEYYSCCSTPAPLGSDNFASDPVFLDYTSRDLHLQSSSPCIDTGCSSNAPVFDYEFNTRPVDGDGDSSAAVDVGAYEYVSSRLSAPSSVAASDGLFRSKNRLAWSTVSGAGEYEVWRNTWNDIFTADQVSGSVTTNYYNDTDVTLGRTNYYWVKVANSSFSSGDAGYPWYQAPCDYDGDNISDLAVFGLASGAWYARTVSEETLLWGDIFGAAGFLPVAGDYDGDGADDQAVYDASTGTWYAKNLSGTILIWGDTWGGPGMVPVAGDYDGDGLSDLAVYDLSSGHWYIRTVGGSTILWGTLFGGSGFEPVAGDYDGDDTDDMAVYSAASGGWYIRTVSGSTLVWGDTWGGPTMTAATGDFDNDGAAEQAVYDTSSGNWYVKDIAGTLVLWAENWGGSGMTPVSGNYDGLGGTDMAVYCDATGKWYVRTLSGTIVLFDETWGGSGLQAVTP